MGWHEEGEIEGTSRDAVITATAAGLRSNGTQRPRAEHPSILAVGDSYTFGAKVSDDQTWPASLEGQLGVAVFNGGVSAFGLDQTVLRAESLVPLLAPDLLVVSFISDDLVRNVKSSYGLTPKPFFRIVDRQLQLHNSPVPPPVDDLDPARKVLGYSHLAEVLLSRIAPAYWRIGLTESTGENGVEIACLLMGELAALERRGSTRVVIMAQQALAGEPPRSTRRVLECAQRQRLATLDLFPLLDRIRREDPRRYHSFYFGHMTPEGNRFVAQTLADEIRSAGWMVLPQDDVTQSGNSVTVTSFPLHDELRAP